jgi:GNAT superfamily N-acetyltransferase
MFTGYKPADREGCLAVFDSNVPTSFTAEERTEFEKFLASLPGPYFVLRADNGDVVACGGYAISPGTSCADLCWGMVTRALQGTGIGRRLTAFRLERIREDPAAEAVALKTSQHTRAFYEHRGFVCENIVENAIAPGVHSVEMRLVLDRARNSSEVGS